jgi:uncharacterized membrane protein
MPLALATGTRKCTAVAVCLAFAVAFTTWPACTPDQPLADDLLAAARESPCGDSTYRNFAAEFFGRYCLGCHNSQLSGDMSRLDAPTGINFNTLSDVRAFQNRIRLRAGVQGDMPPALLPVDQPSDEERLQLIRWIDCGAPQ